MCEVCGGCNDLCPCCGYTEKYLTCPSCEGREQVYYSNLIDEYFPPEEYDHMDAKQIELLEMEVQKCERCNGAGELDINNEDEQWMYYNTDYVEDCLDKRRKLPKIKIILHGKNS
jgi:hypothetical protein